MSPLMRDLIRATFTRGRRDSAVVANSLCSHPVCFGDEIGFQCWQRRPSDGLYRTVESVRVRENRYQSWSRRVTRLGPWTIR